MTGTAEGFMKGGTPVLVEGKGNPEALKYGKLWAMEEYRNAVNGEKAAKSFLRIVDPKERATVADFGCGRGRAGLLLSQEGLRVALVDFVKVCLDQDVKDGLGDNLKFLKADLEKRLPLKADFGICFDVLEHIPPDKVDSVIKNLFEVAQRIYLQVSTISDKRGDDLIGEPLHLTVQPAEWWVKKFEDLGCVICKRGKDRDKVALYVLRDKETEAHLREPKLGENPEAWKYEQMYEYPEYRAISVGEKLAQKFLQHAKPKANSTVIDYGCGTGRGSLMLAILGSLKITMVDFVDNCLDPEMVEALTTQKHVFSFVKHDIEKPLDFFSEYGLCTDVMEHIPEPRVDIVLTNILSASKHVFFSICTEKDNTGQLIGEELHVTVHDYHWWLWKLSKQSCVVHWSERQEGWCLFYVSAWITGAEIANNGKLNTTEETIKDNVKKNIQGNWKQVSPHPTNDIECMILGGGPSLSEFEEDIKQKRKDGVKLITLNGAYNWCLDHDLIPSATIMVDARPFNKRFVKPVVDDCLYLIGGQCDPSVFEELPKDRTYIWHSSVELIADILKDHYGDDPVWFIPGGSTVLLRSIPLMRMLGYGKFYLYGCDSCIMDKAHHSYLQPENDRSPVIPVMVGAPGSLNGKSFQCSYWMIAQAQEFCGLIKMLGDEIQLQIFGDGLLAYIVQAGAEAADILEVPDKNPEEPRVDG